MVIMVLSVTNMPSKTREGGRKRPRTHLWLPGVIGVLMELLGAGTDGKAAGRKPSSEEGHLQNALCDLRWRGGAL